MYSKCVHSVPECHSGSGNAILPSGRKKMDGSSENVFLVFVAFRLESIGGFSTSAHDLAV